MAAHDCKERNRQRPLIYDPRQQPEYRWRIEVPTSADQWLHIYVTYCPYCGRKLVKVKV